MAEAGREQVTRPERLLASRGPIRTGERVVWYEGQVLGTGVLFGFRPNGRPRVIREPNDTQRDLPSVASLRRETPSMTPPDAWKDMPDSAVFHRPLPDERAAFETLLSQVMPPGPSVKNLIEEIWGRGYEAVLAGGAVRDVLLGRKPRDLNLVTAMPLVDVAELAALMFGTGQVDPPAPRLLSMLQDGIRMPRQLRIDGPERVTGLPVSIHNVCCAEPDGAEPLFCDNLSVDSKLRDFTCNSLLYDPDGGLLIDPLGMGAQHIDDKVLDRVPEEQARPPTHHGWVSVRALRFIESGLDPTAGVKTDLVANMGKGLRALGRTEMIAVFQAQVFVSGEREARVRQFDRIGGIVVELGLEQVWDEIINPHRDKILEGAL